MTNPSSTDAMNHNDGFIGNLFRQYLEDPDSVAPQWREVFRRQQETNEVSAYTPTGGNAHPSPSPALHNPNVPAKEQAQSTPLAAFSAPTELTRGYEPTLAHAPADTPTASQVRSDIPPAPLAVAEDAITAYARREIGQAPATNDDESIDEAIKLKGVTAMVSKNMEASLSIPTATSVRAIPAKVMFDNRSVINNFLSSTTGAKISFTHLIGYAMVEAIAQMPDMNVSYGKDANEKPALIKHAHVNFGLAIDLPRPDGSRTLVVPSIKAADTMDFAHFVQAYEDIVDRARNNKLEVADYAGTTCTLTNPGGIGTVHSIPRLMHGQGLIVGVGSMSYPAEFAGMNPEAIAQLGVSKVVTLTSTYDHRVIQGAESGQFLRLMEQKLTGLDGFYDRIYSSLRVPYSPVVWTRDVDYSNQDEVDKSARILELIHAYRSRGHLIADTDPIAFIRRTHPDLDIERYGITLWDLDRSFPTGGFGGAKKLPLRDILTKIRRAYCKQTGVEYMHIQDPAQREWFQQRLEAEPEELTRDEQMRILTKLIEAEAFETFLHTKFIGQKRFSLEGGESLIPLLDTILNGAAKYGLESVAIAMAHRGRLNVLCNNAGKSVGQVFCEFDGTQDPRTVQGSGDVKYHLGTEGVHTAPDGSTTKVYLAANPSHLEAANGVLEGVVRAAQDRIDKGADGYTVLPLLIHGDAALAGQGVVQETLNYSQLRGYTTGGTIHVVVNNQIGFTTSPTNGRSSHYPTDIAKGFQMPVFHVNGDVPDEVARVAKLAIDYREEFHKDVFIDMVCYRRRGHNEGDDPSMTQPVMYGLIDGKSTTFDLYLKSLLGRHIITPAQADEAKQNFQNLLEEAFAQTRGGWKPEAGSEQIAGLEVPTSLQSGAGSVDEWRSPITTEMIERIGDAHLRPPAGFTMHPKLKALYDKRAKMSKEGNIDWGFGEILAFGSLLLEGKPVRMSGQDVRRGTFVQRHATTHDHRTGKEWTPLQFLTQDQAKLLMYDSPLSEYGVIAFEYGYSLERPEALVIWEGQFGDFAIGAQTIIDEFISSAEQKWGQRSSLVMMLPHGYEGQGPDHSSARIERYLTLSAEENWRVVQPSTPANHFHMLRRQAYERPRKPLIAITPKQLLRRKEAISQLSDFTQGSFQPVLGEVKAHDPAQVERVILCSGRLYYDLAAKRGDDLRTVIIRLEQLYPLPSKEIEQVIAQYPNAELLWVQDEPENQGPWRFMHYHLSGSSLTQNRALRVVSRPASASTATGLGHRHKAEHEELIRKAFS